MKLNINYVVETQFIMCLIPFVYTINKINAVFIPAQAEYINYRD